MRERERERERTDAQTTTCWICETMSGAGSTSNLHRHISYVHAVVRKKTASEPAANERASLSTAVVPKLFTATYPFRHLTSSHVPPATAHTKNLSVSPPPPPSPSARTHIHTQHITHQRSLISILFYFSPNGSIDWWQQWMSLWKGNLFFLAIYQFSAVSRVADNVFVLAVQLIH